MADVNKYLGQLAMPQLVAEIKAQDAKVLEAAKKHCDDKDKLFDAAGSAATAKQEAIAAAEEKVQALADGQVKLNKEAIATLNGADTVEGSVAKAVKDAKDALQGNIDAVDDKADKNAEDIAALAGTHATDKAALEAKDAELAQAIAAVDTKVGNLPEGTTAKDVVDYVNIKTAGIATDAALEELNNQLSAVQGEISTIKGDYLKATDKEALEADIEEVQGNVDALAGTHATDKAALEGAIALKADKTALEEVSGVANAAATKVELQAETKRATDEEARIAGLVATEKERAEAIEADHKARIEAMEVFWDTTEDKDGVVNKLKEIQDYIASDESGAATMAGNIQANTQAIADHVATDHNFTAADEEVKSELNAKIDKKADKTTVEGIDGRLVTAEGKITTVEGKVSTLEGEMDDVQAAVATKAEAQALTDAVAALEGADAGLAQRIGVIEGKFGGAEGSVEDQIADAKQAAIDAASADATSKANTAEANAIAKANELNTAMNTRVEALEAVDHEHANKELLDTYTQTEANLADAVAKKHEHANASVINGITAEKVAAWDAAEGNAKTYADGLDSAMTTKVDGVDARVKTLEETIVDKADQEDLDNAVERIEANEEAIAANKARLDAMVEYTAAEITAMFA